MRGVQLSDLAWVAEIQYKDYADSDLHFAVKDYPDFLSATAHVQNHVKECWPYEIISLKQQKT